MALVVECSAACGIVLAAALPGRIQWQRRQLSCPRRASSRRFSSVVTMNSTESNGAWVEFPKLSVAGKKLMRDVVTTLDKGLGSLLNPTLTPADVRSFQSPEGNSQGSVTLRSGAEGSKIDFVLGSWLHCNLPFGTLNIATIVAMLGPEIDSPHLLFEFIQTGSNSLVLVLDLLPRKDLVLEPEYLKRFYEDTKLEEIRQQLEKAPHCQYYVSSSLYVRTVVSPTAILFKFSTSGEAAEADLDTVISSVVYPNVTEAVSIWLHGFKELGREASDTEMALLRRRDDQIKTKGVEVDLSSNMPRLFGQEITDRVVAAFRRECSSARVSADRMAMVAAGHITLLPSLQRPHVLHGLAWRGGHWASCGFIRRGNLHRGVCSGLQRKPLDLCLRATAEGETGVVVAKTEADALVDQLLSMVEGTDKGATLSKEQQAEVAEMVSQLERLNSPPEPLQSPLIFGEWDVEYCSNPTAPGGYYRSAIGRLLLRTEQMVQTIAAPNLVGNKVSFAALGFLNGEVSLKGKLVPLDKKWIEITFEPPALKLGSLDFGYGGSSGVKIAILYLDERIRLGRGSRGSLFVFRRRR